MRAGLASPRMYLLAPVSLIALLGFMALMGFVALPLGPRSVAAQAEIGDLRTLAELAGEAPGATYGRLHIERLGVDAPIGAVAVGGETSVLPNPQGPGDVAWYDLSAWPGLGGEPGVGGNAVLSAHVDYAARVPYAGVRYRGPGVFAQIDTLRPGDEIVLTVDGADLRYRVRWTRSVAAVNGDEWASMLSSTEPTHAITLITCGGDFDFGSRSYDERVVVRAERVEALRIRIDADDAELPLAALLLDPVPGCTMDQVWIQELDGRFIGYLVGAPPFVNRDFPERLEARRPFIRVCRYFP